METKSEWKGVGEGSQENACYFWDSGGSRCVVSRVIYRHLTPIKGTCQTSKYWIPLPSTVSPYLSQVLMTTPLFTIRGALSFTELTFPLSLSTLYSSNAFPRCLSDRPIWNYRYCPTVFTLVFPPITFNFSPISPFFHPMIVSHGHSESRESRRPLKLAPL
jgi:hypothetical protein